MAAPNIIRLTLWPVYIGRRLIQYSVLRSPSPVILDRASTDVVVSNTGTETTVYSVSIPGNTLGLTGRLRATVLGTVSSPGGGISLTLRINYGGATLSTITRTPPNATNSASIIEVDIVADDSVTTTAVWTSEVLATQGNNVLYGTSAVDTTSAQTFSVTAQWGSADPGATYTMRYTDLVLSFPT